MTEHTDETHDWPLRDRSNLLRPPAGTDAGGTRQGRRLGASSEHQPTRPDTTLSVGLKKSAALSRTQKHRTDPANTRLPAIRRNIVPDAT